MKKSYQSGLATHTGRESCGAARKSGVEALTGERAGRVFSRVRESLRDADARPDPWRGSRAIVIPTPTQSRYRTMCDVHPVKYAGSKKAQRDSTLLSDDDVV